MSFYQINKCLRTVLYLKTLETRQLNVIKRLFITQTFSLQHRGIFSKDKTSNEINNIIFTRTSPFFYFFKREKHIVCIFMPLHANSS